MLVRDRMGISGCLDKLPRWLPNQSGSFDQFPIGIQIFRSGDGLGPTTFDALDIGITPQRNSEETGIPCPNLLIPMVTPKPSEHIR
jgi:hypothetical protein